MPVQPGTAGAGPWKVAPLAYRMAGGFSCGENMDAPSGVCLLWKLQDLLTTGLPVAWRGRSAGGSGCSLCCGAACGP